MGCSTTIEMYGQTLNATGAELLSALDEMADGSASTRLLKNEQEWTQNHLDYRVRKVGGERSPFITVTKQPDQRSGREIRVFALTPAGREALKKYRQNTAEELPEGENQIAKLTKKDVEELETAHEEFRDEFDRLNAEIETVHRWIDGFDTRLRALWILALAESRDAVGRALVLSERVTDESDPDYSLADAVEEFRAEK